MGGGETWEVDEVPDGLYYGLRSSDFLERGHTGPTTQLRPTTWSLCVCVSPPQGISDINLGAEYVYLFVRPDVRQGHRRKIFLWSLGALSQSKTS